MQLILGEFNSAEAIELIAQLVQTKIKYHENKISNNSNEEDIKTSETKIKRLQQELFEFRKAILSKTNTVKVDALIKVE